MSPVLRLERGLALCLLFLLLLAGLTHGRERQPRVDDGQAVITTPSQCIAQTINYITHSLPQSCPTSTRPKAASISAEQSSTSRVQGAGHAAPTTAASETSAPPRPPPPAAATSPTAIPDEANGDPGATPFMSFEDWKEMMLRRAGQDPQELRQRKASESRASHRAPPDFGDSALGEEGEISLVFNDYPNGGDGGGGGEGTDHAQARPDAESGHVGIETETAPLPDDDRSIRRSQDAGKTCKERFSYSSFDAGATILKTGKGTKNAKAILVENQDSYMLLECATENKFIIVELSDDILIDTVVIANFEFFSSMIRHFRVSVSDRYPVKMDKWRDLGVFEARNSRDIQPFLVQNPQIWAKYVRLEFITHYGNEYYCPVSLLRVHGSRMLDSWKDSETGHEDAARDEDASPTSPQQNLAEAAASLPWVGSVGSNLSDLVISTAQLWSDRFAQDVFHQLNATCVATFAPSAASRLGGADDGAEVLATEDSDKARRSSSFDSDDGAAASPAADHPSRAETAEARDSPHQKDNSASASPDGRQAAVPKSPPPVGGLPGSGAPAANTSTGASRAISSGVQANKKAGSTASASSATPTVQEGFFNSVTKRLQQVETNLTLSLKYVEDQSRHIQDAIQRTEHKQIARLTVFLGELNQTVLAELRRVQDQYDQMWQSTVLALENQREQSERDIVALSSRLNVLADEVVFQKRMAILHAVLLLSCLFLVIFSRGSSITHLSSSHSEQTSFTPLSSTSRTFRERHPRLGTAFETRLSEKICDAGDRYLAVRSSSEESQYTVSLLESHAEPEDDILTTKPSPELVGSDRLASLEDRSNVSLRRPAISNTPHNDTRKPLPSLPEHPPPAQDS